MKTVAKFCLLSIFLIAISCDQESIDNSMADIDNVKSSKRVKRPKSVNRKSSADIISPISGVDVTGTSTLHRNKKGITVNFKAKGLTPGAYTLWWVIWNYPELCATPNECGADADFEYDNAKLVGVDVLFAAGHVVGKNGVGNFSAHLNLNDASESINDIQGLPVDIGGLHNAQDAEVHLVLRTHGPKVPGVVNEQISSYEGGCDDPFLYYPFTEYPDAIGECADIVFAVHSAI